MDPKVTESLVGHWRDPSPHLIDPSFGGATYVLLWFYVIVIAQEAYLVRRLNPAPV